jgi:hypothetical protein
MGQEIFNLSLFIISLALRLLAWGYIYSIRHSLVKQDVFLNLFKPSFLLEQSNNVGAVNACIMFFQLFKYTRSFPKLSLLSQTLSYGIGEMVVLCVIILVLLVGYSMAFHIAFGHTVDEYRDFWESFFTLSRSLIGDVDLSNLRRVNRFLGPFLFTSFVVGNTYAKLIYLLSS